MLLRPALALTAAISLPATIALFVASEFGPRSINFEGFAWTAIVVGGHAVIALGLLVARERGKLPLAMSIGLGLAAISPLFWFIAVWTANITGDPFPWLRTAGTFGTAWAVLLMVAGVALCQRAVRRPARIVQAATVGCAAMMGLVLPIALFFGLYLDFARVPIFRSLATGAVLTMAGLLTGLIIGRLRELDETPAHARPQVGLACPRCGKRQELAMDGDRCRKCGLWIKVQVP